MRIVLSIVLGLVLLVLILLFKANNPSNDYYISLFKDISGFALPDNVEFISKKHKEYFVQGEFSSCFVVRISDAVKGNFLKNAVLLTNTIERSCGSSQLKLYLYEGIKNSDYPFMDWYISEDNHLWAYYEKY